jgi:hypothetical protein
MEMVLEIIPQAECPALPLLLSEYESSSNHHHFPPPQCSPLAPLHPHPWALALLEEEANPQHILIHDICSDVYVFPMNPTDREQLVEFLSGAILFDMDKNPSSLRGKKQSIQAMSTYRK